MFEKETPAETHHDNTEARFWVNLEFRVCHEFAGLAERRYRYFWCDGLYPREYVLGGDAPRVTGKAVICNGGRQYEWGFTLLLPASVASRDAIRWGELLPPGDVTRWMRFDEELRYIEFEPTAAEPDLK